MAIYLLANKETHLRQLKKIVTFLFGYHRSLVILIMNEANHYFNGFVSGQLLESCILMFLMYVGFKITGLPFPELIAFIGPFPNLIPMFGGYFGFAISFILVLAINSTQAIIFTICFVIIQQFSQYYLSSCCRRSCWYFWLYVLLSLVIFETYLDSLDY